jgi:hypothetical protein
VIDMSRPSGGQPIRLADAGRLKIIGSRGKYDRLESSPNSKLIESVMAQDR